MRSAYAETVFSSCEVESKEIKRITLRARHYTSLGTQVVTEDKRQKIVKKLIRKYRNRAMTLNLIHQSLQDGLNLGTIDVSARLIVLGTHGAKAQAHSAEEQ